MEDIGLAFYCVFMGRNGVIIFLRDTADRLSGQDIPILSTRVKTNHSTGFALTVPAK